MRDPSAHAARLDVAADRACPDRPRSLLGRERRASLCSRASATLGVGAGLGPPVDRADDQAVAAVVQQRRGERQPAAHVAERVVAHDRDVPERARGRCRSRVPARRHPSRRADPAAEGPQPGRARTAAGPGRARRLPQRRGSPPDRSRAASRARVRSSVSGGGRAGLRGYPALAFRPWTDRGRGVAARRGSRQRRGRGGRRDAGRRADERLGRPRLRPGRHAPRAAHRRPRGRLRAPASRPTRRSRS